MHVHSVLDDDELIDRSAGRRYVSEEARRLASPVYYRDYGLVARVVARRVLGRFEPPDASAREEKKVALAVAVADQQKLPGRIEDHHLDAPGLQPKPCQQRAPEAIEQLDGGLHHAAIARAFAEANGVAAFPRGPI